MDRLLQIALIVGVFAIAIVLFQYSQNGRYQYSPHGDGGNVVDTRTGEYWDQQGNHFEPREARITVHHPSVDNETESDDRINRFRNCLHDAVAHKKDTKDCTPELDLQAQASEPATSAQPSTSSTSH